ncbi:MAG: hypothetical protein J7L89_03300, partial [Bacteroidales bacterium]|nr:hypothetical protein [Bacteroidales bacterium]
QYNDENIRNEAINIFLDCHRCDVDYIRRELPYVNYVRDRQEADVHILITQESTGSGGKKYRIHLIGQGQFEGIDDQVIYISSPDDTRDKIREGYTRMLAIGMMKYVGQTPLSRHINISYDLATTSAGQKEKIVEDKWKSWVFDIGMSGQWDEQETYNSLEFENDISAEKVTPDWKIEFAGNYDEKLRNYRIEDTIYRSEKTSASFRHLLVKSITDHWSVGGRASFSTSSYSNTQFSWSVYPAVEYNVFPYDQSSRKQLRIQYRVGYGYTFYQDTTIYDKIKEGLFGQQLSIALGIRQPWGSLNGSLRGFTYLHDWSKNSLKIQGSVYFRVLKGLSLKIRGDAALIHNQLSLPKAGATPEEILLRQIQIASQYDYSIHIGFSYTFGSIYNNVVNPRFGDRY